MAKPTQFGLFTRGEERGAECGQHRSAESSPAVLSSRARARPCGERLLLSRFVEEDLPARLCEAGVHAPLHLQRCQILENARVFWVVFESVEIAFDGVGIF